MEEIIELILAASNPENEGFEEAQQRIIEIENEKTVECIDSLTDAVSSISQLSEEEVKQNENTLFLIYGVIKECFKRTVTKIDSPKAVQKTDLEDELFLKTLETAKIFFHATNNTLRKSAVNLFTTLLSAHIEMFTSLDIIHYLLELISGENGQEILSGAECLTEIASQFEFQNPEILSVLTEAYTKHSDDTNIVESIIFAMASVIKLIGQVFDEDKSCEFIGAILQRIDEDPLKKTVYNFVSEIAEHDFGLLGAFLPFIFERSKQDLADPTNEIVFDVAILWKTIIEQQKTANPEEESEIDLSEYVSELTPLFLNCLSIIPTDVIPKSEWEPYFSVLVVLNTLTEAYQDIVVPLLNEMIDAADAESEESRVAAASVLSIVVQCVEGDDALAFQCITNFLDDSCKVVLMYALTSLNILIKRTNSAEPFMGLVEKLFEFSHDLELCKYSVGCLYSIIKCNGFTEFQIIENFTELIQALPPEHMNAGLHGFAIAYLENAPEEIVHYALGVLFQILESCPDLAVHDVSYTMYNILKNTKFDCFCFFEEGYKVLKSWIERDETAALIPISMFAKFNPEAFLSVLEEVAPIINSFLESEDPNAIVHGIVSFLNIYEFTGSQEFFSGSFPVFLTNVTPEASTNVQCIALSGLVGLITSGKIHLNKEEMMALITALLKYADTYSVSEIELASSEDFISITENLLKLALIFTKQGIPLRIAPIVVSLISFPIVASVHHKELQAMSALYKSIQHQGLQQIAAAIDGMYAQE